MVFIAGSRGVADAAGKLAQLHIDALYEQRRPPEPDELEIIASLVSFAFSLDDHNPDWMAQKGRILEWQAFYASRQPDPASEAGYRNQALTVYRRAVKARPRWAWAWLDLAFAKFRAGEFDDEFQSAFLRIDETAPWQESVQLSRSELGFFAWYHLSVDNRRSLIKTFTRLAKTKPRGLIQLATSDSRKMLLCTFTAESHQAMKRFCK